MNGAAPCRALWWRDFRRLPFFHHHRDTAMADRLIDAAAAEPDELLRQLGTPSEGLTTEAAAQRLAAFGPNLVAHEREQSLVEELIGRAKNPRNFLLLSLAAASYFLGDQRAAAVIAVMVLLSVSLAFAQEHRSNGDRQAPQFDPELRGDGCPVHRQDRYSDPGQNHPDASFRFAWPGIEPRPRIRLSQQSFSVRLKKPAGHCRARPCRDEGTCPARASLRKNRRAALRF